MKKIGIYKITNPIGKIYIGQSTDIENRLKSYSKVKCKDQPLLYNSFLKYDFLHHKIEIIALCDVNQLNDFERKFIKDFDSNNRNSGLNLTSGGQDYFYHNKETRAKMSIAQMGNKKTLGRVQTKEEIQKRIKKIKGLKRSEEFKEKCRKRITGKKLSEATIEKLKGNKNATAKTVIDIKSGELFYSAVEASKKIGIKKTTLTAWLNGQNTNKSNFRYL